MNLYFADTNLYLRFLLQDNRNQTEKVKEYFRKAQKKKLRIIFLNPIIIEMEVVLRKVYGLSKAEIIKSLLLLIKTPFLDIEEKQLWLITFERFSTINIDLLDIFLFEKARAESGQVLSFDKDFTKLAKLN